MAGEIDPTAGDVTPGGPPTPLWWRAALALAAAAVAGVIYVSQGTVSLAVQSALGFVCLLMLTACFSANLRLVSWRTLVFGIGLQVALALFILKLNVNGYRPGQELFGWIGSGVRALMDFSSRGAAILFGALMQKNAINENVPAVFNIVPTIVFVSSLFTVLYFLGILQLVVRGMGWVMMRLMRTSGAETLSASANVFMGQTEAPLIIKPYIAKMTQSELLAMMVGGMATISGGMMVAYIGFAPEAMQIAMTTSILTTSVMAAPCGLYLSKLILPETGRPVTAGFAKVEEDHGHANVVDAAAAGASDGMKLAINVVAMLIAFIGLIALIDTLLQQINPELTLGNIFAVVFSPLAFLMGVESADVMKVADLLGTKLALTEFVGFVKLGALMENGGLSVRSFEMSTFALTGFANFVSVGIQIGGIGALVPERRRDLARLGLPAMAIGFMATVLNAALAGVFLS